MILEYVSKEKLNILIRGMKILEKLNKTSIILVLSISFFYIENIFHCFFFIIFYFYHQ